MKREDKLISKVCLDEIAAVTKVALRPMTRKQWLMGRKWHRFQKDRLAGIGYTGGIRRYPGHVRSRSEEE